MGKCLFLPNTESHKRCMFLPKSGICGCVGEPSKCMWLPSNGKCGCFDEIPKIPTAVLYNDGTLVFTPTQFFDKNTRGGVQKTYTDWMGESYSSGGAPWYSDRTLISNVIFEDELANPGNLTYFFYKLTNLISVKLCESITEIGQSVFESCSNLEKVYAGNLTRFTKIGNAAFENCSKLTFDGENLDFGGVKSFGDYAFYKCANLSGKLIVGENNYTTLGFGCFQGCSNINSLHIGDGVSSISKQYVFAQCNNITEISGMEKVTSIAYSNSFYTNDSVDTTIETTNDFVKNYDWSATDRNVTFV